MVTDFYIELKRVEGKVGKSTKGEMNEIMTLFTSMAEQLDVTISASKKEPSTPVPARAQSPTIQRVPSSSNISGSPPPIQSLKSSRGLIEEQERSPVLSLQNFIQ